ncbi:MAG: PorT family protein [Chlorobi bacterium]|nr:PorT family protein [Chlorobiota bacterium]
MRYDDSSQKLETLSTDSVFNYQSDTLFLLVLAIGEKSLFYFNDKNERKKFFVKTDTAYTWLEFRKYLNKHEDGLMDMVTVNGYIIQLAKYLDDCQKISHKISKAEYNPEYLTSLFKDYYKCTSQTNASIKGINKKPLEFGVLAGATLTNVVFKSKSDEAVYKTDFSTSTNFTFGMKIEAFLPRGFNRWSFNNEILFTNYTVNGYFEDYIDENKYSKSKASVGFLHLRMSNMLRYTYALGKFSVFVNAGITNGMTLARTDQVTTEIKLYSSARTVTEELFGDTQGWEFGFNLGLGTKWKRISFEYRYEWGSSFIGYGNHSSATHRNYFLLGYAF